MVGVRRSARSVISYATSGLISASNIYILQCALILDGALRADGSAIRGTLSAWPSTQYRVISLEPTIVRRVLDVEPRRTSGGFYGYDLTEDGHFRTLPGRPVLDLKLSTRGSIYHLEAEERANSVALWEASLPSDGVSDWRELGLLALNQIGWRSNCVRPDSVNLRRILPPVMRQGGTTSLRQ